LADPSAVILDDRLLIEELLVGLAGLPPRRALHTTTYWYYRACRAAAAGAGGHLSGPFERLGAELQRRGIVSLLELRDDIGLPDPRATVPVMAAVAGRHARLNLLNLEVVSAAQLLRATVWLSEPSAAGVLPAALEAEGVPWRLVRIV
jgi:hypothetical protein